LILVLIQTCAMREAIAPKKVQFGKRNTRIEPQSVPQSVLKTPKEDKNEISEGSPPAYENEKKPRKSVKFTEDVKETEHRK